MPYTMTPDGADKLEIMLRNMGEKAQSIAAQGLYDGAGVMADEIQRQAQAIATKPFHYTVFGTREPSPEEKSAVTGAGVGIAKFEKSGSNAQTSVGYSKAGYADVAGKIKPIPKIANAINSGTSFMRKQPFFRKAVNNGKGRATQAICDRIEEEYNKLTQSGG